MRGLLLAMMIACFAVVEEWSRLPSLPDREGFAGPFAGVSNGALLVGGGANFPNEKPWNGGKKVWYNSVFVLERPDGKWRVAGSLPRHLGYGVSVTHHSGVVCVGGSDSEKHYADAFRLEWKSGELVTTDLATLPKPLANTCGAMVGNNLYIAGGIEKPDAAYTSNSVYQIDLSAAEPRWKEIDNCPGGGRMLAVAASIDGSFWLAGGVDLVVGKNGIVERKYLQDAYRYNPDDGWRKITDLPYPVVAAPTPAPTDASGFYALGGDDGSQIGVAPDMHPGFNGKILRFDIKSEKWTEIGKLTTPRVVTVPCVHWHKSWVVPNGETQPGIRSPDVWSWTPKK